MKILHKLLFLAILAALVSCTKQQQQPETPQTGSVPFTGEWIAASDPFHIVLESETGSVQIPGMGEVDDAALALMLKMMLAQEFNAEGLRLSVSENRDAAQNVHFDFRYEGETLSGDGTYADNLLTVEIDGRLLDEEGTVYTLTAHVFQQTENDLTFYLDKEQLTEMMDAMGPELVPVTKVDGNDIAAFKAIEIGLRLVRDGRP